MSHKAHGQIRRGYAISVWGPGALIDLPNESAIVGGLDTWPMTSTLQEIVEPRLTRKLQIMTGVTAPRLFEPPSNSSDLRVQVPPGIVAWRFPAWFVVQDEGGVVHRERSRRLVHRKELERGQFENRKVVATRFVSACPKGHVADINWHYFVHRGPKDCRRRLWLDESGPTGDLSTLVARCECGESRNLYEATQLDTIPLGTCNGARPWLGLNVGEDCNQPSRLLIRTASNAYFSQVVTVLSIPDRGSEVKTAVNDLWSDLSIAKTVEHLDFLKGKPKIAETLAPFSDAEVLEAIQETRGGEAGERPVKQVELDALVAAPEGFGDEMSDDLDFLAHRLPEDFWCRSGQSRFKGIEAVTRVQRLREVRTLIGFTRFEAVMPDIDGEYETDVERAQIAIDPEWFPAVENFGEGIFVQLSTQAVRSWLGRDSVKQRLGAFESGHIKFNEQYNRQRQFYGGPYVLLHTLAHLLIQSIAMYCGYPAGSIRERIYVDDQGGRYGLLLYTASPDADGTLGGLVQQARHLEDHLSQALKRGELCSNDPICAQHAPGESLERSWLNGAACHGCSLIGETSCEMHNEYLDRALVVPILGVSDAAFFPPVA